nr:hypothetical protein [Tanacetum cinerariifolium]
MRRREGKEPESTSTPKEKETRTAGKSTQGSKFQQKTASKTKLAEDLMETTQDLEEPSHQEFETGAADDQPIAEASQHPEWFQQQKKPPTPDRVWNKTLPATHDEQRNLYKALVEAYKADKAILDTYGDSTILKRRREDDDQEGPSAGSNRGSKRQKEGGEQASASTPSEKATEGAGRSTTGSQSRQMSASANDQPIVQTSQHPEWFSGLKDKKKETTCQMEEPPHPVFQTGADDQPIVQTSKHPEWFSQPRRPPSPDRAWNTTLPAAQRDAQSWISDLARQTDARSSFNELLDTPIDFSNFIMHRLSVDTLTPNLLAGRTYELMIGSCTSLTELEYHLEEVYKATTDQLDWVNPEGQQRIIAVTELQIVEWHDYKHLDWISVRRDDDQIYKFKEGDFKRLRLQDIEDMLLLLVQGKLSNLTVDERLAFNVSLRMFTRSIVIKRRVKDLQLGVESYQKRLNLTKPDTYRPDLRRREAYTAHSNPRGFIYQNKDKKNRLMRIDELHKTMDMTIDQQVALDKTLVPNASRLRIGKSNFHLRSDITSKESTLQLVYDVLRLTPFYKVFLVTSDVSEIYMRKLWVTTTVHHHSIRFKMDNKKRIVNLEYFRDMLHICLRLPGQTFDELLFEEEILSFLRFLGHNGEIRKLTDVNINKLHQPWISFEAVINKCLSGKSTSYDSLQLSQAQILWGMYHKKNVDFAFLL